MEKYYVVFNTQVYEDPSDPLYFFERIRSGVIYPTVNKDLQLTEQEIDEVLHYTIKQTLDQAAPDEVLLKIIYKHPLSGPIC